MARYQERRTWRTYLTHPATVVVLVALFGVGLVAAPLLAMRARDVRPEPSNSYESPADLTTDAPVARQADPAPAAEPEPEPAPETELIAFYVNWGDEAYQSLEANLDKITVLMPMWYHIDSTGRLTVDNPARQAQVMQLIEERGADVQVMPLVNNYDKATETWNAPAVSKLLAKPSERRRMAEQIVQMLKDNGFSGVNIDFENFTEKDRGNLVAFMEELYPLAKADDLTVSMDVIVGSKAYDHTRLAKNVDYLIPMMYDQHWKTSGPGPISGVDWYTKTLNGFWAKVPPSKTVIGLGTYSYDWGKAGARAASLTWSDARALARTEKRPITLAPGSLNSRFSYEAEGITHQVWMLDSISAFNSVQAVQGRSPRGYAIWRLGAEDPGLWTVLDNRDQLDAEVAESLTRPDRTIEYDAASGQITGHRLAP